MLYFFLLISVVKSIPIKHLDLGHCGRMEKVFDPELREHLEKVHDMSGIAYGYDDFEYYNDYDTRIVGGFDSPDPVPWFVMLKINTQNGSIQDEWGHQCGGTLITNRHILTAAHCVCNKYVHFCLKPGQKVDSTYQKYLTKHSSMSGFLY